MYNTMFQSHNIKVKYLANKAMYDVNSIIYSNLSVIAKRIGCNIKQALEYSNQNIKRCLYNRYVDVDPTVGQIKEVLLIIHNGAAVDGFTIEHFKDILFYLCRG